MDGGRHFCLQCDDLRAYHFIILRLISKYIAYYHIGIAELSARVFIYYVGLEICVNCFIENPKITVMWLIT